MPRPRNKKDEVKDFNLFTNGWLYQFFLSIGLTTINLGLCKRRVIVLCVITWLPLFLLTVIEGIAFSGVQVPFIADVDAHVRFLISLPLLIYGEMRANEHLKIIVNKFTQNDIVATEEYPLFNSYITSTVQGERTTQLEIFLILFVLFVGYYLSRNYLPLDVSVWYATTATSMHLPISTYWYLFISLPIFQFLLLRWYYRIILWYLFLWRVSGLRLRLNSIHPDHAGGLGFLTYSLYAFIPFLLAHTVLLTGMIFNRIWHTQTDLLQFQSEIIFLIVFLIVCPLLPLIFFTRALVKAKILGTLSYQSFAQMYVDQFRNKWLMTKEKEMLGSQDIQSLADLSNSYEVSVKMRITPFSLLDVIQLVIVTALPLLPLILIYTPLDKITQLISIIF